MTHVNFIVQTEKLEKFEGEEYEDVEDFLVTLDMYLQNIHIPAGTIAQADRYKVVILHLYLTGQAREFWMELNPARKSTYALATNSLRGRFPCSESGDVTVEQPGESHG